MFKFVGMQWFNWTIDFFFYCLAQQLPSSIRTENFYHNYGYANILNFTFQNTFFSLMFF